MAVGPIPEVGDRLVAGEVEAQRPTINRTAAVVIDNDVGGEATAPIVGDGVVNRASTSRL